MEKATPLTLPTGRRAERGFTLLELLVAMTVSSIILASAYATFATASRSSRTMDEHAEDLQSLRNGFYNFRNDLQQIVPVEEKSKCQWAEMVCSFPLKDGKSIRYDLQENRLFRLLSASGKSDEKFPVADGVKELKFEYRSEKAWQPSLRPKEWPEAVRMTLTLERGENMSHVVMVPVEPAGKKNE